MARSMIRWVSSQLNPRKRAGIADGLAGEDDFNGQALKENGPAAVFFSPGHADHFGAPASCSGAGTIVILGINLTGMAHPGNFSKEDGFKLEGIEMTPSALLIAVKGKFAPLLVSPMLLGAVDLNLQLLGRLVQIHALDLPGIRDVEHLAQQFFVSHELQGYSSKQNLHRNVGRTLLVY